MSERTIIPFGPQHPVLPEPIHLDLVLEDEKVVEAIPSIGFVHRGLEMLVTKRDFHQMTNIVERVCGICSFMHGLGYCQCIEDMMKLTVPERALYLRSFWSELSRMHSHLLWLGLLADAFGFESLFMQSWRIREKVLDIMEETTGGRVILGSCCIGGVKKDVEKDVLKRILHVMADLEKEITELTSVFEKDYSVQKRTKGLGVLTKDDAYKLGAVGPMYRGSGVAQDMRMQGYAAYGNLDFAPVVEEDGDGYARMMVRCREVHQSIDLIRQIIEKIPSGPIGQKVTGNPKGEAFSRLEQPRGEVVYYVKGNGTKLLDRVRVRTPTFANIPPLLKMLQGCDFADVPLLILTIDPCISCTER
ncbi:MAG: nickel-dependent hydrogenase large subunit [Bacillota bacterium]